LRVGETGPVAPSAGIVGTFIGGILTGVGVAGTGALVVGVRETGSGPVRDTRDAGRDV
jgi:hypothetical protein